MKQFSLGLLTVLILAIVGVLAFRATTSLMSKLFSSPSPSPSALAEIPVSSIAPAVSLKPSASPEASVKVGTTTKGGLVKGTSTVKTVTTTTTTSNLLLTLIKSTTCPVSYMTEVKDITGPLTLKYWVKDGYSARINVWRRDGNELVNNTLVKGSGTLSTISGVDYMKVRVESQDCSTNGEHWITVTAER